MAIDPAPRVDRGALLGRLRGGLSAGDALHVRFGLSERPPDADLRVPGAVYMLRVDLEGVALPGDSRGLEEVGAPHRHAIVVRCGERPDLEIGATVPPDWSDRTVDLLVDELPGGVQSLRQ